MVTLTIPSWFNFVTLLIVIKLIIVTLTISNRLNIVIQQYRVGLLYLLLQEYQVIVILLFQQYKEGLVLLL